MSRPWCKNDRVCYAFDSDVHKIVRCEKVPLTTEHLMTSRESLRARTQYSGGSQRIEAWTVEREHHQKNSFGNV
jgi:hypothetical protein